MAHLGESGIEYVYETDSASGTDQVLSSGDQAIGINEHDVAQSKDNPFAQLPEYELTMTDVQKETVEQKLQKLWLEVIKFQEKVVTVKDNTKLEEPSQQVVYETGDLLKKLDSFRALTGDVNSKIILSDPQGTLNKKLLADIDKFKGKVTENETTEKLKIDYQLYYPIRKTNVDRLTKISDLRERLANLDNSLGKIQEIPTPLVFEAANKSLLETVSNLVNKSKTLETQNWTDVENKAGMVLKRMDQISEKRDIMEQKSKMDKISELYHIMLKWQKLSSMLPQVADRLMKLKTLHEQSLEFKELIGHLEVTQQQIGVQLKGHNEILKLVWGDITKNLSTIKNNCEHIENKLKKVNS